MYYIAQISNTFIEVETSSKMLSQIWRNVTIVMTSLQSAR